MRRTIVGVMGSGVERHENLAFPLGEMLAGMGVHLLTGGGQGVMASVSEAFAKTPGRAGNVIGILPALDLESPAEPRSGYPNQWVEIPIYTHLPLSGERGEEPMSRNHINVLSSDAIVALPGGAGTQSEARLARRYGKRIISVGEGDSNSADSEALSTLKRIEEFIRTVL